MKKQVARLAAVLAVAFPALTQAGSIDYLTNQSADYIRTLGRNAATDGADIISYNPAGTTFLPHDGLWLSLSNQTVLKRFEIEYGGETFDADDPTFALPSFHAVYKWESLTGFLSFTVPAGGGSLTYEKGVPFLVPLSLQVPDKDESGLPKNGEFEGSSMYLAPTLGAAYEFADIVSISAAARLVYAKKTFTGQAGFETKIASLDATKTALGVGGIFGLHIRPIKQLDIGVRYEMQTSLEFETESKTENLLTNPDTALAAFADGAKEQRDLPATLGVGIAYHPIDMLTINANLTYYFIKNADNDPDGGEGATAYVISYDDDYDDGIEISGSVEVKATDDLLVSVGYDRAIGGGNEDTWNDFEFHLDSHAIGAGLRYEFLDDRLRATFGVAAVFYDEGKNKEVHPLAQFLEPDRGDWSETFNKSAYTFALGIDYRAF